jgi:hypothetical protein
MLDFSTVPDMRRAHTGLKSEGELAWAAHMYAREGAYRAIFGESHPDGRILTPPHGKLAANWPGGGIFAYKPGNGRRGWHYVTHGLSQPEAPAMERESGDDTASGLGVELVISTPDQCEWAPHVLFNLVSFMRFHPAGRPVWPRDRLPCGGPLLPGSKLTHLLATLSPEYENAIRLPGGHCDLVHLAGVTDAEMVQAKSFGTSSSGSMILEEVLLRLGAGVLTDPGRDCLAAHPKFTATWQAVREELENRWRANGWTG